MSSNFLNIEYVSDTIPKNKIKEDLKFKTGNFIWQVKFNIALDPKTVNNVNLYVTSVNQTPLKTSISYDTVNNTIEIKPLEPYSQNESYILNITRNVQSKGGQHLKDEVKLQFKL